MVVGGELQDQRAVGRVVAPVRPFIAHRTVLARRAATFRAPIAAAQLTQTHTTMSCTRATQTKQVFSTERNACASHRLAKVGRCGVAVVDAESVEARLGANASEVDYRLAVREGGGAGALNLPPALHPAAHA